MIDRMRQGSIIGSIGPGRQRSLASVGQPDRPEGEDQLGPTTSHLGPCCRRTSSDPADEPDVLYSLATPSETTPSAPGDSSIVANVSSTNDKFSLLLFVESLRVI